ncbi:hypothetical protein KQX54_009696 [Cotesia glomerata]|uniref:Metalloendopeptidase n=1 Tax=Cotesia glomerata TaxID=32391 RepID=A0AAV7IZI2_COTGL|nr:hypothetical protein KQX54_009696 [Cotesia glomerata]
MINSYVLHGTSDIPNASEMTRQQNLLPIKVKKSVVVNKKNDLWNLGIIHYEIDDIFTDFQRRIIKQGIRMWEECYYIENDQKNKGRSELSLADGCEEIHIILHELGHVLGFYHEHQHPDRDQYIEILHMNIQPGYQREFGRYSRAEVDTLRFPYD